jgi:hypothetical protein
MQRFLTAECMFGGGWWWSVVCAVVGGVRNEPWVLTESILVVGVNFAADCIVLASAAAGTVLRPVKFPSYLVVQRQ